MSSDVLIFALLLSAGGPMELASLVEPAEYFKARGIADDVENLARLAAKDSDEPKAVFVRTLAIRELARRKDSRATLEAVATGPKGIARDAAEAALAEWDGKPAPRGKSPDESVRLLAAAWFPPECGLYAGLDLRRLPAPAAAPAKVRADLLAHFLEGEAREEVWKLLERTGGLRVDRLSLASAEKPDGSDERQFIRVSGRFVRKAVADYFAGLSEGGGAKPNVREPEDGVTAVNHPFGTPVLVIGDTDLIVTEADSDEHPDIDAKLLEIRSGKKPGLPKGLFAKDLKALSADAVFAAVGNTPQSIRRKFEAVGFTVVPPVYSVELVPVAADVKDDKAKDKAPILKLRVRLPMDGEPDAVKLLEEAEAVRKKALEALKEPAAPLDAESAAVLSDLLRSAKLSRDGSEALGEVTLSAEAVAGLWRLLGKAMQRPSGDGN
jgi:hypothetical protein